MLRRTSASLLRSALRVPAVAPVRAAVTPAARHASGLAAPLRTSSVASGASASTARTASVRGSTVTAVPQRGAFFTKHACSSAAAAVTGLPPLGSAAGLKASNEDWEYVYEGNIAKPLTQLKSLSAGSLVLALVSAPVILTFETEVMDATGRALLAAITLGMGVGTTLMTNLVATPYVCRFFVSRHDPRVVEIVTASFWGRPQSFRMLATEPVKRELLRPLVTFQHEESKKYFYVQEEFCQHPVFAPLLPHLFEAIPEEEVAATEATQAAAAAVSTTTQPVQQVAAAETVEKKQAQA